MPSTRKAHGAEAPVQRCTRCILPSTFPDIRFDDEGVCNLCLEAGSEVEQARRRAGARADLEALCRRLKETTRDQPYDCIVALSGGKDSTYTLLVMTEQFDMRCLAITIDNGFLSPSVADNVAHACDALGVDHMQFRPPFPFMRRMYRKSLDGGLQTRAAIKRASAVCNSCINLINTHMVNAALRQRIPLIAGGYLGGQLPRGRAIIELNPKFVSMSRSGQVSNYARALGAESEKYFNVSAADAKGSDATLHVTNPLVALDYDEEKIVEEIGRLGWRRPADTGRNSSNCLLNDYGIFHHYQKHHFHPYEAELAELVRTGQMTREAACRKIEDIPAADTMGGIREKLGDTDRPD